jgi:hypothetical protein
MPSTTRRRTAGSDGGSSASHPEVSGSSTSAAPKALRRRLEQMRKDIESVARLEAVRLSQANIKDGTFDRTGAAAQ